jgi:hypothetical protein
VRREQSVGFRHRYGARPLHLAGHLVALAIAAFAIDRIFRAGGILQVLVLYLGFVIAHDLIFVPLYTVLDRLMRRVLLPVSTSRRLGIPVINHVRVPLVISALLLLIYGPLIFGFSESNYYALSGHQLEHYVRNWLAITAALLLGSGLIYAARVLVRARQVR